jgi:hypothetical protein
MTPLPKYSGQEVELLWVSCRGGSLAADWGVPSPKLGAPFAVWSNARARPVGGKHLVSLLTSGCTDQKPGGHHVTANSVPLSEAQPFADSVTPHNDRCSATIVTFEDL